MSVRRIVLYSKNAQALRRKSAPIKGKGRLVKGLIQDLKETLAAAEDGIGLAAPQINVQKRVVVVRLGGRGEDETQPGPPFALVNPQIVEAKDERRDFDGCLSFPGLYGETIRPHYLRVKGLDARGVRFDRLFTGFDAVVVHHEIDHLNGVLFIDRVESLEDLYQIRQGDDEQPVRVPLSSDNAFLK